MDMEIFVLTCLLAMTPETDAQKELAAKCHQAIYAKQSDCWDEAERLKRAFEHAENTRNEGPIAVCERKMQPKQRPMSNAQTAPTGLLIRLKRPS